MWYGVLFRKHSPWSLTWVFGYLSIVTNVKKVGELMYWSFMRVWMHNIKFGFLSFIIHILGCEFYTHSGVVSSRSVSSLWVWMCLSELLYNGKLVSDYSGLWFVRRGDLIKVDHWVDRRQKRITGSPFLYKSECYSLKF